MNCPKCKESKTRGKSMSPDAQAFYEGIGIVPIYLCTCCGCSVRKDLTEID
jgi:hypothetical protein